MLILAIDTTGERGGVAIFRERQCLASVAHEGAANTYSVALFEMLNNVIARAQGAMPQLLRGQADIELYAVATGPGSFTGIRVGLAAVQGWAKVFNRPVCGVSILEAMVEGAKPETQLAIPLLNAYRGEFYAARFIRQGTSDSPYHLDGDGLVLPSAAVRDFIASTEARPEDATCIMRSHDQPVMALREGLPVPLNWKVVSETLLDAIALIGYRAARQGKLQNPSALDAYYIRRVDAELKRVE